MFSRAYRDYGRISAYWYMQEFDELQQVMIQLDAVSSNFDRVTKERDDLQRQVNKLLDARSALSCLLSFEADCVVHVFRIYFIA
jgi:hypothetical protein